MNLIALPAFTDNHVWTLHDGRQVVVVDPGDSAPVIEALDSHKLELAAILVTHRHGDHVGGVDALRSRLRGPVCSPKREGLPRPFVTLDDAEHIDVPGQTETTQVCCDHSCTSSNLTFAHAVEPTNHALAEYTMWCEAQCAVGEPTLPSSTATLRQWKNDFR